MKCIPVLSEAFFVAVIWQATGEIALHICWHLWRRENVSADMTDGKDMGRKIRHRIRAAVSQSALFSNSICSLCDSSTNLIEEDQEKDAQRQFGDKDNDRQTGDREHC